MEELVGGVSSVLSECAQYSNDSTNLDRLCAHIHNANAHKRISHNHVL